MPKQSVIKRKKNPGFLVPLVLALAVTFLFYKGTERQTLATLQPVQVPIAKVQLSEHTLIKKEDIGMVTVPGKGVPPNIIRDPNELVGKYVGTKYTVPKNGYFYKDAISKLEDIPSRISMMLGPNELGVTMRINLEKSVANSLKEGQYVQVRFFTSKTPSKQLFEGVLEDKIKILALRDSAGTDVVGNDNTNTTTDPKAPKTTVKVPTIVVFEATDEQVSYLLRAQNLGELNIVAIPEQTASSDAQGDGSNTNNTASENKASETATTQTAKDILDAASKSLTSEQKAALEKILQQTAVADKTKGYLYTKNPAKLLIDSMSFSIQQLFAKTGILATPNGEIVYYDPDTQQIRYFKDKAEYEGSVYALTQLSDEEIAKLKTDGKLTDEQLKVLQDRQKLTQEPQYSETTKGELFQIVDGKAVFYTNEEVIKTLTDIKQKNGRLSSENQALLDKLTDKFAKSTDTTAPATKNE